MTESQHIYLTGYRGTGKTSVGKILAETLKRPLVDLDDVIESAAETSIREIFAVGGETAFRDLETQCLQKVAARTGEIVSLGGGAILRSANRQLIASSGVCIWLRADAQTLAERIDSDASTAQRRPALTTLSQLDEIRQLLDQREPLYREVATHHVDTTGNTVEAIADKILVSLENSPT